MHIFKTDILLFILTVFFVVAITAPLPVSAAGNNASCIINTAPSSVTPGQTFFAQVDVTNTGSSIWTSGAGYNLGSQSPQDNYTWGTARVALPLSPFYPGWAYGFSGYVTAPTTPGSYAFAWRMVQDGVEWFGTSCSRTITVSSPCTNIYSSASCAQFAGQYGIPSNYTVGTANYYYNSCTSAVTYTGGCSPPAQVFGSCSSSRYSCSSGSLGATAEYPSPQAPTTYAYQWWCMGSNGGSDTLCTEWKPVTNGSCSTTLYSCSAGTRGDYFEYPTQWQWWCNGQNGGINILCSKAKSCTQLSGPTYYCSDKAGQYGIPSNYTVGTVNYTYNSCTFDITLIGTYGGCTAPAVPTASLTITDNTANSGTSHNLTIPVGNSYTWNWSSANGTSWSSSYTSNAAYCGSGSWIANTASGSNPGTMPSNQAGCVWTVNYTVTGSGGTRVTDTVQVTVPASATPTITSFTSSPTGFSAGGGTVTLSWTTLNATSCTLTGDGLNVTRDPRSVTSYTIPNRVTRTATYALTCSGPGGTTTR